jgi:hypothetical protein
MSAIAPVLVVPGGSYPDALPTGEHVVLLHGRRLETHRGIVPFPPGESFGTMFNRLAPDGRRFAGLKHDGGGLAENTDGAWSDVPGPFAGSSPLIYNLNGELIHDPIVYADGSVSSQGYRYIDEQNRPVTGQDTYATPDGQINQFSLYRDVTFGQGHEGGLVVRGPDGVTRLLASENPFDIRVQGIGPIVAVSFWDVQPDGLCAYIYIATLAEYLSLPPVVSAPVPPPVQEPPQMKKCEVTVDAFTLTPAAHLPDGTVMQFHDRENPNGAHVRVWVENGSCRMSIDYPGAGGGLKGETGARRPVR